MSTDKRTVATDALETLGTIIDSTAGRDAIHLAVEPVIAGQALKPGQDVGIEENKAVICDNPIGIVDPFLKKNVKKGERFWLVIYPRQITSLRHVWTHPAFPEPPSKELLEAWKRFTNNTQESEKWLRDFCDEGNAPSYDTLIESAFSMYNDSEYLYISGEDASGHIPNEMWDHIEAVTGRKVPYRAKYFSCSC